MSPSSAGPWRARFLDGPAREHERHWVVGPVWQRIHIAHPGEWSWVVVGGDGVPLDDDAEPWDDETIYELDHVTEGNGDELFAYYREVTP